MVDDGEYSDEEEVVDTLLSVEVLLGTLADRRLPKGLGVEVRQTLERVRALIRLEEHWVH